MLLLYHQPGQTWETLTKDIDLNCEQHVSLTLQCDYRLLSSNQQSAIHVKAGDIPLNITSNNIYPMAGSVTAILFLVDTSDPGRQNVLNKNYKQIVQIVDLVESHHILGLASFDKDLIVQVPLGDPHSRVVESAETLQASGLTTELYRNVIVAVQILSRYEADRKAIFLFSDGQAEDKAYFHQDVINVARSNNVIINSFGFARTIALSVALQSLRRLSEETGGSYYEADPDFELNRSILSSTLNKTDNGGRFTTDLSTVDLPADENQEVLLNFAIDNGDLFIKVPISLPKKSQRQVQTTQGDITSIPTVPTQTRVGQITPIINDPEGLDKWLWYGVPLSLLVLIILVLISLFLLTRKQLSKENTVLPQKDQVKPYAYLITQDEKAHRYPITNTIWRIGRSLDNEMTISDSSMSRRHAEIHRYNNGKFVLFDLGSTNGVYVNNKKIEKKKIKEGDIIEIGDVFFRFTQNPSDFLLEEETAMLKTKAPYSH